MQITRNLHIKINFLSLFVELPFMQRTPTYLHLLSKIFLPLRAGAVKVEELLTWSKQEGSAPAAVDLLYHGGELSYSSKTLNGNKILIPGLAKINRRVQRTTYTSSPGERLQEVISTSPSSYSCSSSPPLNKSTGHFFEVGNAVQSKTINESLEWKDVLCVP